MKKITFLTLLLHIAFALTAQTTERWQQRIEYTMDIDFDVKNHQYVGKQTITYYNNSPDVLKNVYYHLYFNAFQPNSMMDMRNKFLKDSDPRVASRISKLTPQEIGYNRIKSLKQNGKAVSFKVEDTILEVTLAEPIAANGKAVFEMEFEAQVPLQIRRSGRNNREGIDYSMSQWYPKMCQYDYQGWHANPYIGREFYGVWGDFDVKISIDNRYVIGATGYLQNADDIGYGYSDKRQKPEGALGKVTWHFKAPNVHDFVWGADPDYTHEQLPLPDGFTLHFFYQKNDKTAEVWKRLPEAMAKAYEFIKVNYGDYPYKQYSFIQGGDGGMEYPMATLITGERPLNSLVGVAVHEWMHSWYQMLLATNESLYAWMDEGFTSYASDEVMNYLVKEKVLQGTYSENTHRETMEGFARFAMGGNEEPLSVHADHYNSNQAYGVGAYVKGAVFLRQLHYIVGEETFKKALLDYYNQWKYKHPNPNDFIRVFEKASDLELDWYKEYMVYTTRTIDYALDTVQQQDKKTLVRLKRVGDFPMPTDVTVTEKNGKKTVYNIPLDIMRGAKPQEDKTADYKVLPDWYWTHPTYEFTIDCPIKKIAKIEVDAGIRTTDTNRENNLYEKPD